eukprot:TRINITY_DN75873_c0_g1_i1.p1 TRINITY_DN75873_c0_g1~~TRINITY_DN75873_c0_g1_i1.p1  ORF type:complete len:341 (+),score=66.89 TRINITY_DN75873_c0_g1_i1:121-1143(+)
MAFAASLSKIVVSKKQQQVERQEVASKWLIYEAKLLDQAVELFKQRCLRETKHRKCQLAASFEVLSRDVEGFPTHVVRDSTYVVASWGGDVTAESWFYSTHGSNASWSPGAPVLFAEMLEGMMPKFLERLQSLGFSSCGREAGTWKVSVAWKVPEEGETWGKDEDCTYAQTLSKQVAKQQELLRERQTIASKWEAFESKLLDQALILFKQRCTREAEQQRLETTVSFEVLSREITDFPKRIVKDSNYFVHSWGDEITAESWFYATHGTNATYAEDEPVLFAEVLECMMPKFLERLQKLGFLSCRRDPGTWKMTATWADPDDKAEADRKRKRLNGNADADE